VLRPPSARDQAPDSPSGPVSHPRPGGDIGRLTSLVEVVREDRRYNGCDWTASGFQAVALHRVGRWLEDAPLVVQVPGRFLHRLATVLVRNLYGIEIPQSVELGRRVVIGHQSGIVIHPLSVIGDGCIILHNSTLAGPEQPTRSAHPAPRLGNDVWIGVGAVVLGGVTVGDGAHIGPNVVVTTDIPAGAVVVAEPPRVIRRANPG
jgi:serine O-acetyltransferase